MTQYISKKPNKVGLIEFSNEEHQIWHELIERQLDVIENRACDEFITGLEKLNLNKNRIPDLNEVNEALKKQTGWQVEPVDAVIPPDIFFHLLAHKKFPAATFIRRREDFDYIKEPDIFHELFGHCPLLTHHEYAHFMQAYGQLALTQNKIIRKMLLRLFWFTIEFGLLKTSQGLRIYGGGILSSFSETKACLEGDNTHLPFSVIDALRTPFRIDIEQPIYFIIDDFAILESLASQSILEEVKLALELGDFKANQKLQQQKGEIDGKFAC